MPSMSTDILQTKDSVVPEEIEVCPLRLAKLQSFVSQKGATIESLGPKGNSNGSTKYSKSNGRSKTADSEFVGWQWQHLPLVATRTTIDFRI